MVELTAHRLWFEVEAVTPVAFHPYTGSALRGALIQALQGPYCAAPEEARASADHRSICPVCWLLAFESRPGDSRRPYTIEPLLGSRREFSPGERFTFGVTLFGRAVHLFPYLALAVPEMGRAGVGRRLPPDRITPEHPPDKKTEGAHRRHPGRGGRGRFVLRSITAGHPLTGERQVLLGEGQSLIQMPQLPVTWEQVDGLAEALADRLACSDGRLEVRFLTPTRIVDNGRLCHRPDFRPLFQRLFERVCQLCLDFGEGAPPEGWTDLEPMAASVTLEVDDTHWWDVRGHSRRLGRPQPLGGFVGRVVYRSREWRPLLPWLLWGVCAHVGKNAVKGGGIYTLSLPGSEDLVGGHQGAWYADC